MARSSHQSQFPCVTTAGGLLPADFLLTLKTGVERQSGSDVAGLQPVDYHLGGETFGEATNRAWNALQGRWEHFKAYLDERDDTDTAHGETWDRFLRPLFRELGYGQLERNLTVEIDTDTYKITHHWRGVPIHLLGAGISIDKRTPGAEGAARKSPHAMVQEFLNRSDHHLWAFVANGLNLRILRDNISLTRQAYVEFDLFAIFEGGEYADFQLLWLLCHQSRVEGDPPETCWLERWATEAKQRGVRMLDGLRDGVETSISALGEGFLKHPDNRALRERLTSGELSTQDYYRQVLRIVYRLIFLFVAEDRNLLLVPDAPEEAKRRYRRHYATDRLRELAERRRGSVHHDLWEQIKLIMRALGSLEGQPALALPALGSFLWEAERSTPDLADVTLSNTYLLDAIRALATIRVEKEKVRRVVDYRNLGAEELGSVYESLLELHPQINLDARTFALDTSAGNERKTSGSYYTPDSLVQCLLDTALEPVIKDRLAEARKANHGNSAEAKVAAQQQALLDLKVCDPAVGSGHFLIAAGHRIARHLARIRSGEEEPSPADYQDALRDVVGRCLYGVDIKPMAVELCKVSLWIEAMEPGKPLSFLDHHIRCGNSLLGTTPALIAKGIPDDAYKALTGDDAKACTFLKSRNKGEREGFGGLFVAEDSANLDALRSAAESVESIDDDSITALQRKEQEYSKAESSYERLKQKQIADLWCAAFVWEKKVLEENAAKKCTKATGLTTGHLQKLAKDATLSDDLLDRLRQLSDEYQFFHWHVEFPSVFRITSESDSSINEPAGLTGGFDALIGNPPWERIKVQEKEWFAKRSPEIAMARSASIRRRLISGLEDNDFPTFQAFQIDCRLADASAHFFRATGAFPRGSKGDINTYALFAELNDRLMSDQGRSGLVIPPGIATDDTYKEFIQHIVETKSLVAFYAFTNRGYLFPEVESTLSFSLFMTSRQENSRFLVAAKLWNVEQLKEAGRVYCLTPEELKAINPNTLNLPIFENSQDAEIVKFIQNTFPVVTNERMESNEWEIQFSSMFHMTNDAESFHPLEASLNSGFVLEGNMLRKDTATYLPLYESKLIFQMNHRAATFDGILEVDRFRTRARTENPRARELSDPTYGILPRYWIDKTLVEQSTSRNWLIGFRNAISAVADSRSLVASVIPYSGVGNSLPLIETGFPSKQASAFLVSYLNSFIADYVIRQKASGGNLNFYILKQLPIITPGSVFGMQSGARAGELVGNRSIELSYTAWDLEPFAQDCGYDGPPFRWDEVRRFQLRCELDALFFHLYLPCDDAGDWKPARIAAGAVRDGTDEELATLKSHFPTPRDAVAYIMETFPIVKKRDIGRTEKKDAIGTITREGTYLTKDRILEIYDQMLQARRTGQLWQSPLDPPPGPPTDADGNFIPFEQWSDDIPSHIHPPRVAGGVSCSVSLQSLSKIRSDFARSQMQIFRLPKDEVVTLPKSRGDNKFYARITNNADLPANDQDPDRSLWVLEAFSKSWFDSHPFPERASIEQSNVAVADYYATAELYALEIELIGPQIEESEIFQFIHSKGDAAQDDKSWFIIEAGEPRGDRSIEEIIPLNIFASIYQPATSLTLASIQPVDSETQGQLNAATSTARIPDATEEELYEALANASGVPIDWVTVYDVGQGASIGFGANGGGVSCYVDMGGGTRQNQRTFPGALQQFCFSQGPPIILSHWHDDHYSSANRDPAALAQTWIAPRQTLGTLGAALMSRITSAGGRLLFLPANFSGTWFGSMHLELCSGVGLNNSGIAVTLSEHSGGQGQQILLPGDARYTFIPSFSGSSNYASIVTPHHGGVMAATQAIPGCAQSSNARLVYSCGSGNSYGHPKPATRQLHDGADWRDPDFRSSAPYEFRTTETRGTSGLGHVQLFWQSPPASLPLLPCGGGHCQLRGEQT